MKRFFLKLTGFVALLIVLLIMSYWGNKEILSRNKYYVDDSVKTIILGSSMAGCGLNPALFDNSVNISSSAEPFVLSYLKLKDVLPESHSLETVILSCSYSELFIREDNLFKEDRALAMEFYRRISFYNELPAFHSFRPFTDNFTLYYEVIIRNRILFWQALSNYRIKEEHKITPYIDGYDYIYKSDDSNFAKENNVNNNINYKHYSKLYDINLIKNEWNDLAYVDSIIQFSQDQGINLVLVALPINSNLFQEISVECKKEFESIKQRFSRYQHVEFLDFSNSIEETSFFKDHVHLRSFGADSISKVIYRHINAIAP